MAKKTLRKKQLRRTLKRRSLKKRTLKRRTLKKRTLKRRTLKRSRNISGGWPFQSKIEKEKEKLWEQIFPIQQKLITKGVIKGYRDGKIAQADLENLSVKDLEEKLRNYKDRLEKVELGAGPVEATEVDGSVELGAGPVEATEVDGSVELGEGPVGATEVDGSAEAESVYQSLSTIKHLPVSIEIKGAETEGSVVKYKMSAQLKSATEEVSLHSKRFREFVAFKDKMEHLITQKKTEDSNESIIVAKEMLKLNKYDNSPEMLKAKKVWEDAIKNSKKNLKEAIDSSLKKMITDSHGTVAHFPPKTWNIKSLSEDEIQIRRVALQQWLNNVLNYMKSGDGNRRYRREFLRFLNAETYL
jgi:hypothetical protein